MVTRVAGGVIIVYAAFLLAVVESFLVPFKAFGGYLPVSALFAVLGNWGLPMLMIWLCRVRYLALLPAAVWFVVILAASTMLDTGSLVIANMWPGPLMLVSGAGTIAVVGYRIALGRLGASAKS
ncbi:hypothetical protein STSO111631_18190 [Stackebrandtia soli]